MATRLYLASTGTAAIAPAVRSDWERSSAAFIRRPISTVKQNTALTTLSAVFGATTTSQTCYYQGVSDTLDIDQSFSGCTVDYIIGKCGETTASGDAHIACMIRVMADATTERALLHSTMTSSGEFPLIASAATRIRAGQSASDPTLCLAGDRIVIEIGIHGITPANEVMQMRIGDPTGTADFALTAGLTTDLVPWFEFSKNLTFGTPTARKTITDRASLQAVHRASSW